MDTGNQLYEKSEEHFHRQNWPERIKKYNGENLESDLNAACVSVNFRVSISILHDSFKKHLLQSYRGYVEKEGMNEAIEMIRSGKRIREIMAATGYKNHTTFFHAFKKTFRRPPGMFKNY